ncbi:MAG: DUF2764 domain-containing protein [Chlamydiae bacterium CG10_big_fil_rev_8_21_14_0_10_42_34]|nr:MAG: DUF2764 domain-containing protein [Chlamydiae bacterium CG10_big_fil_rev_8_21_14_0_10_42_34]
MYSMANYYFLLSAFPTLSIDVKPDMSFKELRNLLDMNLTSRDKEEVKRLLRPVDLYNIRALWLGQPLSDKGNFTAKELEEELIEQDNLPSYLIDFMDRYESTQDRLRYFSSLFSSLYRDEQPSLKGFLAKYYKFERELRLVLTGLRAKMSGKDLVRELQFEDPTDPLIAEILAQAQAPDYTPPREFEDLKNLFMSNSSDPQKLNRAILEYRLKKIEEMEESQDFGIDRVLAFVARLMLVESIAEQDKEKGTLELL